MEKRYLRNIGAISESEQITLFTKRVLIVGCGGLGGYLAEFMARLGVGEIRICDFDAFDETNLNRQLISSEINIGKSKVDVAVERLKSINSGIRVIGYNKKFDAVSAGEMLADIDVALDALDNTDSRLTLEAETEKASVPFVFAALSGWEGQITTVMPGDGTLKKLYKKSARERVPVMPFTPAAVAAFQASEAVKLLLGRQELEGKLLVLDSETNLIDLINLI